MDPTTETPNTENTEPAIDENDPIAAMERGIEAASEAPAEPVEPAAPQAGEGEAPAEGAKPEGEAPAAEGAPAAKAPEELAADAAAKAAEEAAKPDADTEKEVDDLKLKGKSADRFRELSSEVKAAAPVMAAIKEAGITPEQLPTVFKAANDHKEWVGLVAQTGLTPDEYGALIFDYGAASKRAAAGDMEAAKSCYEKAVEEARGWAQLLGIESPIYDPLEAHQDLKDAIDDGDMTRKAALEVARSRQVTAAVEQRSAQEREATQATTTAQQGLNDLIAIDAEFKASDADYARKRPILNGIVATIRQTLPPTQWAQATRNAYKGIVLPPVQSAPPPQAQTPAAGHVPLRPTGTRANLQPDFDNPMDAMEAGIAAAAAQGR